MKQCCNCKEPIANKQYECDLCGWEQGFEGGGIDDPKLYELKPGDKITRNGIEYEFSYWSGKNPAFVYYVDGKDFVFINRDWNRNTPLKEICN